MLFGPICATVLLVFCIVDVFTDEQLFIIFEFEDSGHDLESFEVRCNAQFKG